MLLLRHSGVCVPLGHLGDDEAPVAVRCVSEDANVCISGREVEQLCSLEKRLASLKRFSLVLRLLQQGTRGQTLDTANDGEDRLELGVQRLHDPAKVCQRVAHPTGGAHVLP